MESLLRLNLLEIHLRRLVEINCKRIRRLLDSLVLIGSKLVLLLLRYLLLLIRKGVCYLLLDRLLVIKLRSSALLKLWSRFKDIVKGACLPWLGLEIELCRSLRLVG
jgi:hypothetical protein